MILSLNTRWSAGLPAFCPNWIADVIRGEKEHAGRIVARDSRAAIYCTRMVPLLFSQPPSGSAHNMKLRYSGAKTGAVRTRLLQVGQVAREAQVQIQHSTASLTLEADIALTHWPTLDRERSE
jgi:hypothetical protein